SLVRDRGALAMAFLLPPLIFVIFAAIFSGLSGDDLRLQVALGVPQPSPLADRLEAALRAEPLLRTRDPAARSEAEVVRLVRSGKADVGLVLGPDLGHPAVSPATILVDPGKPMAGAILAGQVQRVIATALPDLALSRTAPAMESILGGFTPEQAARLAAALRSLAAGGAEPGGQADLVRMSVVGEKDGSAVAVTYYAGAVAILFLLFSAMQSATTLIEERDSGVVDRVAVGPGGPDVVVLGKFLFLAAQGVLQASLIFLVAWLVYGVDVGRHVGAWLLITCAAALAAAGLGLAVAAACATRQQAQTASTFIVLVLSAVGGSMAPRFMMPPWLQAVGSWTPNAWAIEAYHGVLWRGETLADVAPQIVWLLATALVGAAGALALSRLRLRM
ncbi:MAG TPA: ABC transporter permease, partial [Beijerinckiaceae bacterium]